MQHGYERQRTKGVITRLEFVNMADTQLPDGQVLFFDLETDQAFDRCPGATRQQQANYMQVTVLCALECDPKLCVNPEDANRAVERGTKTHFWRDVVEPGKKHPFEPLFERMDASSVIVAYNGLGFDYLVLRKHYGHGIEAHRRYLRHRAKTLDPFSRIREATDVWPKLDTLLRENGLETKTANGLEAIKMFEEGRREELLAYCVQDVAAMARLCLLGELKFPGLGTIPNALFGVASCLPTHVRQREDAENFVMVSPPRKRERDELDGELVDRPARVLVSA